jgi:hypothetical protein
MSASWNIAVDTMWLAWPCGAVAEEEDGSRWRRHGQWRLHGTEGRSGRRWLHRLLQHGAVGEIGESLPVILEQIVTAGADVIADRVADRRVDGRILRRAKPHETKQLPHWLRGDAGEKLSTRVGPTVVDGTGHVKRSRGRHGKEHVGIDG